MNNSKGTYVSLKVKNKDELYNWFKNQGIERLDKNDLHCTLSYSKKEFRHDKNDSEVVISQKDLNKTLVPLGNDGAVVLKFKSSELQKRFSKCKENGAISDYPNYQPHISIFYDRKGNKINTLKDIKVPDFDIVLHEETVEELDLNWKDKITESLDLKGIKTKYIDSLEKFNVYEFSNKISIDLIVIKDKNSGVGTKIMKEIVQYADNKNLTCVLSPSNEFGGNKKRLIEFYKRFGFVENKGKNKEFGIFETMYRLPNKITEGLNMEIKDLLEDLSKQEVLFVTEAMKKEGLDTLDESSLEKYLELFEEYKGMVLESEIFAEMVEGVDVDSLTESEINELVEACSDKIKDEDEDEDEDEDLDESKYNIVDNRIKITKKDFDKIHKDYKSDKTILTMINGVTTSVPYDIIKESEDLDESFISKGIKEITSGNTGSGIENFKFAMMEILSKDSEYSKLSADLETFAKSAQTAP